MMHRIRRWFAPGKGGKQDVFAAPAEQQGRDYRAQADRLWLAGQPDQAQELYRKALALDAGDAMAANNLGHLLLDQERLDEAQPLFELARKHQPQLADAHFGLATVELRRGNAALAEAHFVRTLDLDQKIELAHRDLAYLLAGTGQRARARAVAEDGLRHFPDSADLHLLAAELCDGQGEPERAIDHFRQAAAANPHLISAHSGLGYALARSGDLDGARQAFGQQTEVLPDLAAGYCGLGDVARIAGQLEQASVYYRQALAREPRHMATLIALAAALLALGRAAEAGATYREILAIDPSSLDAQTGYGEALAAQRLWSEAALQFERALAHRPDGALCNRLGLIYLQAGAAEQAGSSFRRALALDPHNVSAMLNLGNALQDLRRHDEAVAVYRQAIESSPGNADAHVCLGSAHEACQRYDTALACYARALELNPRHVDALLNIGGLRQRELQLDAARASFEAALAIAPDYVDARWNKAVLDLTEGRFAEGWNGYEMRWARSGAPLRTEHASPLWNRPLAQLTAGRLLVLAEQGFGDTLQFCRYVDVLASRGIDTCFAVQAPLLSLMRTYLPAVAVTSLADPPPLADYHCHLLSLPLLFGTELASVPPLARHLQADAARCSHWAGALAGKSGEGVPRIGLVWAGNPAHVNDRNRSMAAQLLGTLCENTAAQFYSLQQGAGPGGDWFERTGVVDLSARLTDFGETAAVIANLDLVISVDTAVAHLAALMGKPVWLLLPYVPDFRWLLDRADSPWYPGMRLFRQERAGDWAGALARTREALHTFLSEGQDA